MCAFFPLSLHYRQSNMDRPILRITIPTLNVKSFEKPTMLSVTPPAVKKPSPSSPTYPNAPDRKRARETEQEPQEMDPDNEYNVPTKRKCFRSLSDALASPPRPIRLKWRV